MKPILFGLLLSVLLLSNFQNASADEIYIVRRRRLAPVYVNSTPGYPQQQQALPPQQFFGCHEVTVGQGLGYSYLGMNYTGQNGQYGQLFQGQCLGLDGQGCPRYLMMLVNGQWMQMPVTVCNYGSAAYAPQTRRRVIIIERR